MHWGIQMGGPWSPSFLSELTEHYTKVYPSSPGVNTHWTLVSKWWGQWRNWCPNLLFMRNGYFWKSPSATRRSDLILSEAHLYPVTKCDGPLLEPALKTTACCFLFFLEVARSFEDSLCGWAQGFLQYEKQGSTKHREKWSHIQGSKWKDCFGIWATNSPRHLCHRCLFVTHEDIDISLAMWLLGTKYSSCARQTTKCVTVRRVTSVALLGLFLPPEIISVRPCWAVSYWQTLLRKQHFGTFILDFQDSEKYTSVIEATHYITSYYENRTVYQSWRENRKHKETICYSFKNVVINQRDKISCALTMWCGKLEISHVSLDT